jgi:hypothetical protein
MTRDPFARLAALIARYVQRPLRVRLRSFGEQPNDRQKAESYGHHKILPALQKGRGVILDLRGTRLITQGFFHALLAESIKTNPRYISRIAIVGASKRQVAAIELSYRLLLQTHDRGAPTPMPTITADATEPHPVT